MARSAEQQQPPKPKGTIMVDVAQIAGAVGRLPVVGERGRRVVLDVTACAERVRTNPTWLFYVCIIADIIGMMSYMIFLLGEFTDLTWAPIFALFLQYMFGCGFISMLGLVEEALPFTDILPTATIAWGLTHLDWPVVKFLRNLLGVQRLGAPAAQAEAEVELVQVPQAATGGKHD